MNKTTLLTRISNAWGELRGVQNNVTVQSSDTAGMQALFGSGSSVTDSTATSVSAVYACLSRLGGAVLQLPIKHYKYDENGDRERVKDSRLWWLLNEQPCELWTSASWKEFIVYSVFLRGDQHTEIVRTSSATGGQITKLVPHHPDHVFPRHVVLAGVRRIVYDVYDQAAKKWRTVDQDDMLHFAGFGFDGLRSISAIKHACSSAVNNSCKASQHMSETVGAGGLPQIVLAYPTGKKLGPDQAKDLRESFTQTYTGTKARKIPLILSEGAQVSQLSISPVDMELLSSRRYEKGEICQALGVPPILIGENEKTSSWGTGIEQITIGFVKYTIKPMLARWEEEINRKIFRRAGQFVEFELDALLRGDTKTQIEAFRAALGGPGTGDGWMSVDEVRRLLNMPPVGENEIFRAVRATDTGATIEQTTDAAAS